MKNNAIKTLIYLYGAISLSAQTLSAETLNTEAPDAETVDVGTVDAGAVDAETVDAGAEDVGTEDAGAVDAGAEDAETVDAGADAETVDSGAEDSGAEDAVDAETLTQNETGTHEGFYYTFWKDSGEASFTLLPNGRYQSQWDSSTNNWVGGKGWNPGGRKIVNYEADYGVDNSQNSYLALYGWTKNPLIEYYVVESYGSYNPSSCSGGEDFGSYESDGATYKIRRCQRVQQPSIEGTQTFYQYFSVRENKKGFGKISGTITVGNHFDAWANVGLNLGSHDYMVMATEGYQSTGRSDIQISEGSDYIPTSEDEIVVRALGLQGDEHINLRIGGVIVADWTLTTSMSDYRYFGGANGELEVVYDNDAAGRDVTLDYVFVNGEIRQAENMAVNTATYGNGQCGGGSYSQIMHCNGMIGFGDTQACLSGHCNNSANEDDELVDDNDTPVCNGYVGITFDDAPNANTGALIEQLTQHHLSPVTWFIWGQRLENDYSLVPQMLALGEMQNHSYSHPAMSNYSYQEVYDELNNANVVIQNQGADKPTIFRPPYGIVNDTIRLAAQDLALSVVTWDVDSLDYNNASTSDIVNAANQLQPGDVILMHDGYANTNDAVAQIASNLRSRGLCPGVIDPSTGRAVAPSADSVFADEEDTGSDDTGSDDTGSDDTGSDDTEAAASGSQCNWYGTAYPVCQSTTGWGWENNRSCIGVVTCGAENIF